MLGKTCRFPHPPSLNLISVKHLLDIFVKILEITESVRNIISLMSVPFNCTYSVFISVVCFQSTILFVISFLPYTFMIYLCVDAVGCDTSAAETFPNIDWSLKGYNALLGYPLAKGSDPGFGMKVFVANYDNSKTTTDCRYVLC